MGYMGPSFQGIKIEIITLPSFQRSSLNILEALEGFLGIQGHWQKT